MVMAGRQPSSSFRILRQIVPDGYTLGWYRGGTNLHFGGCSTEENDVEKLE
jgi:hypothetical protein